MKIRHLAVLPTVLLMAACGGSTPEPETPAGEAAGAAEQKPADDAKPAEAKPAEGEAGGGEAAKPAEGGGDEKK
jgi:hypothetical protein